MRKLELDDETWEYMIGRSNVKIKSPRTGKSHIVDFSTITGRPWSTIERGQHKKTSDGMVGPGDVRLYIENTIMKVEPR